MINSSKQRPFKFRCIATIFTLPLLAAILGGCAETPAEKNSHSDTTPFATLSQKLSEKVEQQLIPGAVIMATVDGEQIYQNAVGYKDIANKEALNTDSLFRFYSMSKPITSVAILILEERGELKLDDPVEKYIPEFSALRVYKEGSLDEMVTEPPRQTMTIRHLLSHQSGITYPFMGNTAVHQYYRNNGVQRRTVVGSRPTDSAPATSLEQLVKRIAKAPLIHHPGTRFEYSYSTTVLGYIIEKISGQRLDQFLQENIFAPLQMTDTGFFVTAEKLDRLTTQYFLKEDALIAADSPNASDYSDLNRLLDGGGALMGTSSDYLRFATMLANGGELDGVRLLQAGSIKRMLKPETSIAGMGPLSGIKFGLGVSLGSEQSEALGRMPDGMYGWPGSANTHFFVDPELKLAFVMMTQVTTGPGGSEKIGIPAFGTEAVSEFRKRLKSE